MSAYVPDPSLSLEETIVAERLHTYRESASCLDRVLDDAAVEPGPHNDKWRDYYGRKCAQQVRDLTFMYELAAKKLKEAEAKLREK